MMKKKGRYERSPKHLYDIQVDVLLSLLKALVKKAEVAKVVICSFYQKGKTRTWFLKKTRFISDIIFFKPVKGILKYVPWFSSSMEERIFHL